MPILEVEHISKSFNKTPVLKDVGFNLEKGQAVSIIGSSGSGKTTICSLLPRFYDVTRGRVLVDGIDVRDLELSLIHI